MPGLALPALPCPVLSLPCTFPVLAVLSCPGFWVLVWVLVWVRWCECESVEKAKARREIEAECVWWSLVCNFLENHHHLLPASRLPSFYLQYLRKIFRADADSHTDTQTDGLGLPRTKAHP